MCFIPLSFPQFFSFLLSALKSGWLASLPLFSLLLLLLSWLPAQNTQQTGFKGNLRLLVKTLEQPHLPFKILPAALSHCLHTDCLLMLAACTAFYFTPHGPWAWGGHTAEVTQSLLFMLQDIFKRQETEWSAGKCALCVLSMKRYRPAWWNQRALINHNWLCDAPCQSFRIPLLCRAHSLSVEPRDSQNTKTSAASPHFFPTQRIWSSPASSAPSIHLSPRKTFLWFLSFLILHVICQHIVLHLCIRTIL